MSNQTPNENCNCPRTQHYHGTRNNYLTHACRCTPCTQAATKDRDRHRRLKAYGRPHPQKTDATPARRHIQTLLKKGLTKAEISHHAAIAHQTITRILDGQKTIINTTSDAILTVKPADRTKPAGKTHATGSRRRIQALAAIGYPLEEQARIAGIHPDKPRHLLKQKYVGTEVAEAITTMFNRLQLTPNPDNSRAATQARNIARANGWLPPMCWDEHLIDDPTHNGYPGQVAA